MLGKQNLSLCVYFVCGCCAAHTWDLLLFFLVFLIARGEMLHLFAQPCLCCSSFGKTCLVVNINQPHPQFDQKKTE